MLSLELMAVATNNIVGQKAISESKNPKVLKALSRNPHLCGEVANILAKSRDLSISVPALRKADDTGLLEKSLKRGVNRVRVVYRNLNLPEHLLIDDLYDYDNGAVLESNLNVNGRDFSLKAPSDHSWFLTTLNPNGHQLYLP